MFAIYEMSRPNICSALAAILGIDNRMLFRAIALNQEEHIGLLTVGIAAGAHRNVTTGPKSGLPLNAPLIDRISEYVNGVGLERLHSYKEDRSIDPLVYSMLWPRDSTIIGLYSNPLQAITVGTGTGLMRLTSGSARLYLYGLKPKSYFSVTTSLSGVGLRAKYPTQGEYAVEGRIEPYLISVVLPIEPTLLGSYVDQKLLLKTYLSYLRSLDVREIDPRSRGRSKGILQMLRFNSTVLSRTIL